MSEESTRQTRRTAGGEGGGQSEAFAEAANAFCSWARGPITWSGSDEVLMALRTVLELYVCARRLVLPTLAEPADDVPQVTYADSKGIYTRFGALPINYYGVVSDPTTVPPGDRDIGDPADDLADIYRDVANGLARWNVGDRGEAERHWRLRFETHWGQHAVDALRVLHFVARS